MSPVALTFDDGPDPEWTPQVLDALAGVGIKATFFVVGEQLAEPSGPSLLSDILGAGHSVQPHCTRHVRHTELGLTELSQDITQVLEALVDHGVPKPTLWRPPYGEIHPLYTARVAAAAGLELELWTHDPCDYSGTPAEQMLEGLATIQDDSVILLHDSRRYTERTDSALNTVALIGPLVALIHDRGYGSAPLG